MNYLALRGHVHFNICLKSENMIENPRMSNYYYSFFGLTIVYIIHICIHYKYLNKATILIKVNLINYNIVKERLITFT